MAYAHPNKYDVFFSYASADLAGGTQNWLDPFIRRIQDGLGDHPGGYSLFLDRRVKLNNRPLDIEIKNSARASATFVAFLSRAYLESNWCMDELRAWVDKRDLLGMAGSLFLVSLDSTTGADLAGIFPQISNWRNFELFARSSKSLHILHPDCGEANVNSMTFDQICGEVARDVAEQLVQLRNQGDASAPKIYLAETSRESQGAQWPQATADELERYFEGQGLIVKRDRLPANATGHSHAPVMTNQIGECDLFFQRLEKLEDRCEGLKNATWQAEQRCPFMRQPCRLETQAFFWLPVGGDLPALWPQARTSQPTGVYAPPYDECTLETARRRAASLARALCWRRKLRQKGSPGTPLPYVDLLIVASEHDYDNYQQLLDWLSENNAVLQSEGQRTLSWQGVLDSSPMVEFEEFNGIVLDEAQNAPVCRSVMQVYGYCSENEINRRQVHWHSLLQSPAGQQHRNVLHGLYTAEFIPPPKPPRSTNLRHHRHVRLDQPTLMNIMRVLASV